VQHGRDGTGGSAEHDRSGPRRLTARQLAQATPVEIEEVEQLVERGMLRPAADGKFSRADIQRLRAVRAMRSPGISLDELMPVFEAGYFTLEPIEMLFPEPAAATEETWGDLARSLRLAPEELGRMVVAAGFPAVRPEDPVREDDAELARQLVLAGSLMGGGEVTVRLARIYGEAARRAAEGGLALFEEGDEMRSRHHLEMMRDPQMRDEMNARGARLMRLSENFVAALYRRHLEHGLLRVWAGAAEAWLDQLGIRPSPGTPPGVAFVDLSGYTALTETSGDIAAARLAEALAEMAQISAARHDGRVVKLLGDGAMLHFDAPLAAVRGALDLVREISATGLPAAHGGVHAGPVIERDGDYFGRTVNLAARITAQATAGEVMVSSAVAAVAAVEEDIEVQPRGEVELKGIGSVPLFRASWATPGQATTA
jgi:adenylate cyclase